MNCWHKPRRRRAMPTLEKTLWNAAWDGDLALIRKCLEDGADVNLHGFNDATPLEAAAYHAQADACQLLLDAGADPNAHAKATGETVLHQAITKRDDPRRTRIVK